MIVFRVIIENLRLIEIELFVSIQLIKYENELISGRRGIRIFLPLCGKSLDIQFLRSKGHKIVGVEFAEMPIRAFLEEHSIEYELADMPSIEGQVFKALDGSLKIYQCDIFKFDASAEDLFDAVWDRGAFGAINHHQREQYVDLLKMILKPDSKILLNTFNYDQREYSGPPHCLLDEDIQRLFGDFFTIENCEPLDEMNDAKRMRGMTRFLQETRLLCLRLMPFSNMHRLKKCEQNSQLF
ncbi:hypothetical protein CAPTEDRAFT_201073 [Capitella teleta]|uniref:thiopurine S-methyltransferase n=1 Tax=Capitella teleta TaxID=283909 RepID=R7TCM4_CAPTE|nr:hypothetical protein CAPTEDRAFT_201073 [Capitella teleta]|eukprot:ELT88821.1 hypothetical protein CAPTEDRAFT_201073 [Capitella teleta]